MVLLRDLPPEILNPAPAIDARFHGVNDIIDQVRRWLYRQSVIISEGDYNRAAAMLNVHPKGMHRSLKKYDATGLLK